VIKHLRQQMDLRVKSSSLRKDQTSETLKTKLTSLSAQRIEFKGAAANRRRAGQADGSGNVSAVVAADRAFPAAVAELGR
jgi:hypothetical protein